MLLRGMEATKDSVRRLTNMSNASYEWNCFSTESLESLPAESQNGTSQLLTNLSGATAAKLLSVAHRMGLTSDAHGTGGGLTLWEASATDEMTAEQTQHLGEDVRRGRSLLLTLAPKPGATPFRLGFMLPTTAWTTQTRIDAQYPSDPIEITAWDKEFFRSAEPKGLTLQNWFAISPLAAVERGQSRYECFKRLIPFLNITMPGFDDFWSRSLLNRDWQVRATGNDMAQTALLVTGRYGAGRVAVFAASASSLDSWSGAEPFWSRLLSWLTATTPVTTAGDAGATPTITVEPAKHSIRIGIANSGATALPVQVVVRALTWEGALIGDLPHETDEPLTIAPQSNMRIQRGLPLPSPTNYQALDARNAFQLRVGVLSGDGSTLLAQKRLYIDPRDAIQVDVNTDNLYSWKYPFHAPGPDALSNFQSRMGANVGAYAYLPGSNVNAEVVVSNGMRNLAFLAQVKDENYPANPSTSALNDGAMFQGKSPADGIQTYGVWTGQPYHENILSFTFPHPVTIAGVTLIGCANNFGHALDHNPGEVVVEADGKRVAHGPILDGEFVSGNGRVRLTFTPTEAAQIRIRMPWIPMVSTRKRNAPWLGEISIEGWNGSAPAQAQGKLTLVLRDVLSGTTKTVAEKQLSLHPGAVERIRAAFTVPQQSSHPKFFRLEAEFAGAKNYVPVAVLQPTVPLAPLADLRPQDGAKLSFIVTRGFRNVFTTGTGTAETTGFWGTPDDLIWAYSRQLKQIPQGARTEANRLYVTDSDMKHYSTPWRSFNNGLYFYDVAVPLIVEQMKHQPNWPNSNTVIIEHSDRWDTGPQLAGLHGWQDFVEFDAQLRTQGLPGLKGRTRTEIAEEIHGQFENEWQAWQLTRYVHTVRLLRESFQKEGKSLLITAQGMSLVAGRSGVELAETIRGMSDDSTFGMANNSNVLTTGRQLGEMAFNPCWKIATLIQWGYNSSTLNNSQWHAPAGTTEPSRRHYYDRAWRATVWLDGHYGSIYSYGYNSNAGVSFTMTENDWKQWWLLQERHSLISPEEPVGAGLVISTSRHADPKHIVFSAGEVTYVGSDVRLLASTFKYLHEAGLSLPFATNIAALEKWKGSAPLIVIDLDTFSDEEVAILDKLQARGIRIVAFAGQQKPSSRAAAIFSRPNTMLLPMAAATLNARKASDLAQQFHTALNMPLQFPPGTCGYGFRMKGTNFVVIEDWLEQGRIAPLRLRATSGSTSARACNINDHAAVPARRDGDFWVLDVPLRPGDGTLLAIEEIF